MRIIIADDSAIMVSIIQHFFENDDDITIAGVAKNGQSAIDLAKFLTPDAIIMDIKMPVMDGLEATKIIRGELNIPVLVFSNEVNEQIAIKAYQAGAVEVLLKPDIDQLNNPGFKKYFRELLLGLKATHSPGNKNYTQPEDPNRVISFVVMGASTGGPKTVRQILAGLPADFPVGIALVQHMESGFESGYAKWLNEGTSLRVMLVEGETDILAGHVYVAPAHLHLMLQGNRLILDDGPRVGNQKPAVDVLFSSAAVGYGSSLLGVLLTGMGRDGADGCADIIKKGGITVVQDAATSDIFGMPGAAIEQNAATYIVGLPDIPVKMQEICLSRKGR